MPGTYSQIYIHIVFAVKGRENLIGNAWKEELHKYISGIITNKGHKSIIVNGMSDHIHAFIGLKPAMAIAIPNQLDFMHKIVIPGVHEIAALVAKIACVWWLGINRL